METGYLVFGLEYDLPASFLSTSILRALYPSMSRTVSAMHTASLSPATIRTDTPASPIEWPSSDTGVSGSSSAMKPLLRTHGLEYSSSRMMSPAPISTASDIDTSSDMGDGTDGMLTADEPSAVGMKEDTSTESAGRPDSAIT